MSDTMRRVGTTVGSTVEASGAAETEVLAPVKAPLRLPTARSTAATTTTPDPRGPRHAVEPGLSSAAHLRRALATPDRLTATGVFVAALVAGLWNATDATAFADDEGTYAAQALAVTQGDLAPYTYWYDHPPFGWVQLAVLGTLPRALGVGDGSELPAMRAVVAVLFALTATLVFLVARRSGAGRVPAVAGAAVLIASPLALTLGRQVFLDNVATPWMLLAFWLVLSPRRAMWAHVGAGAAFGVALLTKLTVAVFGPALLLALLTRGRWRGRSFSIVGFLVAGGLVMAIFPLLAVLRSELLSGVGHVSLQDALEFQLAARESSGSFWDARSDRHGLVLGWVASDVLLVGAGLLGAAVCAFVERTRWIPVALGCYAFPMVVGQGYLPAMYVVGVVPFLAVAAAAGAGIAWSTGAAWLRRRSGGSTTTAATATARPSHRALGALVVVAVLGAVAVVGVPQWRERSVPLLTAEANADWRDAVAWIEENVPASDDIVVPYSAWTEIQEQGRGGPWNVVVLEKVDRDTEFALAHPGGWREIEWILEGPTVAPNIANLALAEMAQALEHSRVVVSFGEWHVREVVASEPQSEPAQPEPETQPDAQQADQAFQAVQQEEQA